MDPNVVALNRLTTRYNNLMTDYLKEQQHLSKGEVYDSVRSRTEGLFQTCRDIATDFGLNVDYEASITTFLTNVDKGVGKEGRRYTNQLKGELKSVVRQFLTTFQTEQQRLQALVPGHAGGHGADGGHGGHGADGGRGAFGGHGRHGADGGHGAFGGHGRHGADGGHGRHGRHDANGGHDRDGGEGA